MELSQRVTQGVVDARVGNRLKAKPCVGVEPLIGQKRGQGRHRFLAADPSQLLARPRLVVRRGI